jgi:hypothetical protein
VSEEQEVVAAFFQLVDSLLRAAPGMLLLAEQLPTFITWACASLPVRPFAHAAASPRAVASNLWLQCPHSVNVRSCSCDGVRRNLFRIGLQVRESPPVSAAVEFLTHLVLPQAAGIDGSPDYQVGTCNHYMALCDPPIVDVSSLS